MTLIAYHGSDAEKTAILAHIQAHHDADEIVKGQYWEDGKGCAVCCTVHSGEHAAYEGRFGIPQMLARLEDTIFEGLPNDEAKTWPLRFMGAIRPGADLSLVGWKFLHWLLTDKRVNPGINHPLVRDAVKQCADVLAPMMKGEPADKSAESAAESAARSAESAARSAESAARSAESAARSAAWGAESAASAENAASAAWSAAWSAENAASAAWSAARSAVRAAFAVSAESGESAVSAAVSAAFAVSAESAESGESAAYVMMADKLIELLEAA